MARKKHHKKSSSRARRHSGAKANRRHRRGRKHNGLFSRRGHGRSYRKHNDAGGGSMGMMLLKAVGVAFLGAAVAVGGALLLSSTSLSSMAQDGLLVLGGIVFGGFAFAAKKHGLAVGLLTGPLAVAALRTSLSMGITSRMSSLVQQVQQLAGSTTSSLPAPTAQTGTPAATAPSGWVAATPAWGGQLPATAQLGTVANMTTPMVGAYLG